MTGEAEAAADVVTGSIVASAVDAPPSALAMHASPAAHGAVGMRCANCCAALAGPYCSACGQPAHLHRTLAGLGHDILHSVFHFEGKLWRTLPELALYPGRLTRRYIDGERVKFVSPMALYLFSVFLMYAVFGFTGGLPIDDRWLERPAGVLPEDEPADAERGAPAPSPAAEPTAVRRGFEHALQKARENPSLVGYKVKTNGYKYAWALVPLSIPFVWLLFIGRRRIPVYDHAIFVTYSLSFMMLWFVVLSLLRAAWPGSGVLSPVLQFVPPIHMYRQLRGAYGLSVGGALVRLFFLLIAAACVLVIFVVLLLVLGLEG